MMIRYYDKQPGGFYEAGRVIWETVTYQGFDFAYERLLASDNVVKLFTGPTFNKIGFVDMLAKIMNVAAIVVDDGIILDRGKFNRYPPAHMPVWAWLNRSDINSPLHTVKVSVL